MKLYIQIRQLEPGKSLNCVVGGVQIEICAPQAPSVAACYTMDLLERYDKLLDHLVASCGRTTASD